MAKNKLIKNITTDELATIVNKSFESQTKLIVDGFDKVDENFKKVFNQLKTVDDKLDDINSVKHRVDFIETTLNIQPIKK